MFKIKLLMGISTVALGCLLLVGLAQSSSAFAGSVPYESKSLGVKLLLPLEVYSENKSAPASKVQVIENGNTLILAAADIKNVSKDKFKEKFAPTGTIRFVVENNVARDQIEKIIKSKIDAACAVYSVKSGGGDLVPVEFGPADKSRSGDVSALCGPDHPMFVKYSEAKRKLVLIDVGGQDCIFFNGPDVDDGNCVLDQGIVESVKLANY